MQKKCLQEEVIKVIRRLDYFSLQKLSAFITGLGSVKAQSKESRGVNHEDG